MWSMLSRRLWEQKIKTNDTLLKHSSTFLNAQINSTMENNYKCSERNTRRWKINLNKALLSKARKVFLNIKMNLKSPEENNFFLVFFFSFSILVDVILYTEDTQYETFKH